MLTSSWVKISARLRLFRCLLLDCPRSAIALRPLHRIPTFFYRGVASSCEEAKSDERGKGELEQVFPLAGILNSPEIKTYRPELVQTAIVKVFCKQTPELKTKSANTYFQFVGTHYEALNFFNNFVKSCGPSKTCGIARLTPVELTKTLFLFRNLLKMDKLPDLNGKIVGMDKTVSMVDAFLVLLMSLKSDQCSLTMIIGGLIESKAIMNHYQKILETGLGKFLPELSNLSNQFDFASLDSFDRILEGIERLKQDFRTYLKAASDYNEEFFTTLIPVARYVHLLASLQNFGTGLVKPEALLAVVNSSLAVELQNTLLEISGELAKCDQLVFDTCRNFLNLVYCATGLNNIERIFSTLLNKKQLLEYSEPEKELVKNFCNAFVPLVANGTITSNHLDDVRYTCLIARFKDNVLVPYRVGSNIFDNYEFSLLVLVDLADYIYILRSVSSSLGKPFADSSNAEVRNAITTFGDGKGLLVIQDCKNLLAALTFYSEYSVRNFFYLDQIVQEKKLAVAIEKQKVDRQQITQLKPDIREVIFDAQQNTSDLSIVDFERFIKVLPELQDLNIDYSQISTQNFLRLLKEKAKQMKKASKNSGSISPNLKKLEELSRVLEFSLDKDTLNLNQLDLLVERHLKEKPVKKPGENLPQEYVQIPDDLNIHEFAEELIILKEKVLGTHFKNKTSHQIIEQIRKELEQFSTSELYCSISKDDEQRYVILADKLCRLFMINGNHTQILDSIINSDQVFDSFERKVKKDAEKLTVPGESANQLDEVVTVVENRNESGNESEISQKYLQISDTCQMNSFYKELIEIRERLGSHFAHTSSSKILRTVERILNEPLSQEKYISFKNLQLKLVAMLKFNNKHMSVLDAAITSSAESSQFESSGRTQRKDSTTAYTVSSYQNELSKQKNNAFKEKESQTPAIVFETSTSEISTNEASSQAPAKNSKKQDPSEIDDKQGLEEFLRDANKAKRREIEEKFRERAAYVWSASMMGNSSTLETKQFFTPAPKSSFFIFPGTNDKVGYLLLTSGGNTITSKTNPLGPSHVPQDMLSILERFPESDIAMYLPFLCTLKKNGWSLIGSAGHNQMLVFSRPFKFNNPSIIKMVNLGLATVGFVFVVLLGMNYAFVDLQEPSAQKQVAAQMEKSIAIQQASNNEDAIPEERKRTYWARFLWK